MSREKSGGPGCAPWPTPTKSSALTTVSMDLGWEQHNKCTSESAGTYDNHQSLNGNYYNGDKRDNHAGGLQLRESFLENEPSKDDRTCRIKR
jgi:hypothetical protein